MTYSSLWPSYMSHKVWKDFGDAVSTTFEGSVVPVHQVLKWLRTTHIPSADTTSATLAKQLIAFDQWSEYEQTINILRMNFLGLALSEPDVLRNEDITRLVQNAGTYWFEKGKKNFIDFLGYCLNINLDITSLWTEDYKTFLPAGDSGIGQPIYEGGTWYPTTHVRLTFDNSKFVGTPVSKVVTLFYDVCPYNLVLESVVSSQVLSVIRTDQVADTTPKAAPVIFTGNITHIVHEIPSAIADYQV